MAATEVEDVQVAIDDGTLRERHWLDVKPELGSTDSSKKGLARDLASFANDGGGASRGQSGPKYLPKDQIGDDGDSAVDVPSPGRGAWPLMP